MTATKETDVLNVSLPKSEAERIREAAKQAGRPISWEVRRRLDWSFKDEAKGKPKQDAK